MLLKASFTLLKVVHLQQTAISVHSRIWYNASPLNYCVPQDFYMSCNVVCLSWELWSGCSELCRHASIPQLSPFVFLKLKNHKIFCRNKGPQRCTSHKFHVIYSFIQVCDNNNRRFILVFLVGMWAEVISSQNPGAIYCIKAQIQLPP